MAKEEKTIMGLRLPADLKAWVSRKAEEQDRTMSYIVLAALKAAKEKSEKPS